MRNILKTSIFLFICFLSIVCVSCKNQDGKTAEELSLAKTVLREVEFENSEKVELVQDENVFVVSGEVESMSSAQISAFGVNDVTHVVVFKFLFDKERTIDYFKIEGNTTKVYSTNKNDANYVGTISELLDSDASEDAFCYLILSLI